MTKTTTRKATMTMAMAAAAMLMTATWAGEGVEVMFLDTPQAGQTGTLMGKASTAQPKSAGSEIDSRRDSDRGTGTDQEAADPQITVMDGVQRDGGSWFCKALASTGLDDIVDVSLLCD